jgi:hypothetical protein
MVKITCKQTLPANKALHPVFPANFIIEMEF